MTRTTRFILTLFAALVAAWLLSGERFLDAMFEMWDIGEVDDTILAGVIAAEDAKAAFGLPDLFGALRAAIHTGLGLN